MLVARGIWRLARGERWSVVTVTALGLLSAFLEALGLSSLIPIAMAATGDPGVVTIPLLGPAWQAIGGGTAPDTLLFTMFAVVLILLGILVQFLTMAIATRMAMRFAHDLRCGVFEFALQAPVFAVEKLPSGKLLNNLATDTWRVCDAVFVLVTIVVEAIACLVFLAFLLVISPLYTGILVIATLAMAFLVQWTTHAARSLGGIAVRSNEALMGYLWDAFGGLRVIRAFGTEERERGTFTQRSDDLRRIYTRLGILNGAIGPITRMGTIAIVAGMFGFAIWRGDSLEALIGFFALAYRMQPRVSAVLGARTRLTSLAASVEEVEPMLLPRPMKGAAGGAAELAIAGTIRFDSVTVQYDEAAAPALSDVSCTFERGMVTAVAGRSGAGKSTLMSLLLRFVEPTAGVVLVDGRSLSDIPADLWHARVAFVEQNAFIFNATVRENIRYGAFDTTDGAVEEAAALAQADGFISDLPRGYDTRLGDNGVRLSQGQRQRIAFARALLRRPAVLILDEATNAVDLPTDRALQHAMRAAAADAVVIVIAHREETIASADTVLVLEEGRIVQVGCPALLRHAAGPYRSLFIEDVPETGER